MKTPALFALLAVLAAALSAPAAARVRDGALIRNSGSTNAPGMTVKLYSDGTASVRTLAKSIDSESRAARFAEISPSLAQAFFTEAAASRREGSAAVGGCMKSASFGSTTTVLWHGWASGDLSCPQSGPHAAALASVVAQILNSVGNAATPRRVHLPINEPRRAPVEGSPTPHPSPSRA